MGSDRELLLAWAAGDQDAGNALVERHFAVVFRFFRSKIDDGVDDLTQATFLACAESAERFDGVGSFRAYVLGIARNHLLMHLQQRYRRDDMLDPGAASLQQVVPADGLSPSGVVAERDTQKLLLAALRRLPIDFQIAVELFYWQELKIDEIAQVLDIAQGTVKSRLGRAREMLRRSIVKLARTEDLRKTTVDDVERWVRSLHDKFELPRS